MGLKRSGSGNGVGPRNYGPQGATRLDDHFGFHHISTLSCKRAIERLRGKSTNPSIYPL